MVKHSEFWRHRSMPYVEARRASNSRTCYKPHMHATVSIGAVDAGTSVLIDAGSMSKRLRPETVVWIPAHHRHSCNPLPTTAWSYQMLYVDPQWMDEVLGDGPSASSSDHETAGIRLCENSALYAEVSQLTRLLFSDASLDSKRMALVDVISACQRAHWEDMPSAANSRYVSPALQTVLEKVQQAPGTDFNWDTLASDAGLSRTQLIRAFRKVTGMTPHAWQQNVRINAAREQVRNGSALAEVAYQHGFADQAHFQRVFKSLAGITPDNYRS